MAVFLSDFLFMIFFGGGGRSDAVTVFFMSKFF